jgi:hypothetical protein
MPIRVRITSTSPGFAPESITVEFEAPPTVGLTAQEVDAWIAHLLATREAFELPAVGEKTPLSFTSRMVQKVAVWAVD